MKISKLFGVAAAAVLLFSLNACDKVPAGDVGVRVNLLGGAKGVDSELLTPGRYWVGPNQDLFLFPISTQTYSWTANEKEGAEKDESITFQTSEGLSCNADIGVTYHIESDKVTAVFQKYRKGVEEITHVYLHNIVRDALVTAASTRSIETVYGSGKADLIKDVKKNVQDQVAPIGIIIENISWIGDIRLPQAVTASINNKIQATQQAQQRENEVATAKAEAQKAVAVAQGEADSRLLKAQADAKANLLVAQSLTPELVSYLTIQKWDGELPTYSGSNAVPFLNIGAK